MSAHALDLSLPFKGRWFVMQGGDTINVNEHMSLRAQWYGLDLMKVGGASGRALTDKEKPGPADYFSWGEEIVSPVDGVVRLAVDGLPDHARDVRNPAGNHVVIEAASDRFVFLAHFRKGSVLVRPGQRVKTGEPLGRVGNSGNSDAPHLHVHVQDTPTLNEGNGQEMVFKGINVELTGKTFRGVDWPLIRGLFVWD